MNDAHDRDARAARKVRVLEAGAGRAAACSCTVPAASSPTNPFLDALAERYRVFAPELPGLRRLDAARSCSTTCSTSRCTAGT